MDRRGKVSDIKALWSHLALHHTLIFDIHDADCTCEEEPHGGVGLGGFPDQTRNCSYSLYSGCRLEKHQHHIVWCFSLILELFTFFFFYLTLEYMVLSIRALKEVKIGETCSE